MSSSFLFTQCCPRILTDVSISPSLSPLREITAPVGANRRATVAQAADYGLGPNTYPRGWFIVAESREIDNGPIGVTFFGRDFAL